MKLTDVIRRPLITEKTSILREDGRTIVFHVAPNANKTEIKRAIQQLLGSKVESIRTSISHGKEKRQGRYAGQDRQGLEGLSPRRPARAHPINHPIHVLRPPRESLFRRRTARSWAAARLTSWCGAYSA